MTPAGWHWLAGASISVGVTYEIPLESADEHLQDQRLTVSTVISF